MGVWTDFGHGADSAGQLAKIAVAIAGLNRLHGGAQGGLVLNRLCHQPQL